MLNDKEIKEYRKSIEEIDLKIVRLFKLLSDANRFKIFVLLSKKYKISITQIAETIKLSIPLTSQHLRILENADMIIKEKGGKKVFPKINVENWYVKKFIKIFN